MGALGAYLLGRARPSFALDAIEMTASFPSNATVRPDDAVEKWAKTYWKGTIPLSGISEITTEREYVEALQGTQRFLTTELDIKVPTLRQTAAAIRSAVALQDFREVEAIWTRHDDLIFEALAVPFMKGMITDVPVLEPEGPQKETDDPQEKPTLPNGRRLSCPAGEKESLILLTENFNRDIGFPLWRASSVQRPALRRFATGIAVAIARKDQKVILRITEHLADSARYRERVAKEFATVVDEALRPFMRFVAKGVMTNSGRSSYSLHRKANLFVRMRGHATAHGPTPNDLDLRMRIELPDVEGDAANRDSPVLVEAGAAIRFTAVAHEPAVRIEREEDVRKAFEGGSVKAYLTVGSTGIRNGKIKVARTPEILFRDIEQSLELGPKRRKLFAIRA
ncbi:hypothetical protein [Geodermatophilus africanus]|nr:hypothetical protein [Geodermatophilus africanus]